MSEAQKILDLIESLQGYTEEEVLRDHTDMLDEIDARVYMLVAKEYKTNIIAFKGLAKERFEPDDYGGGLYDCALFDIEIEGRIITDCERQPPEYTRSRDALKAARNFSYIEICIIIQNECSFAAECEIWFDQRTSVESPVLPTECLAELHAIIQARDWICTISTEVRRFEEGEE